MPKVSVSDAELFYERHGARGDPAVLVHGSWVDHHSWDAVAAPFGRSLEVLVYDRRGHGESSGALRRRPVRDDAADLAALLEAIDLYPVHVVAHSYGGAVAFRLAADRPEMVRSLVLHEPSFVDLLGDDPATAVEAERLTSGIRRIQALVRAGELEEAAREFVEGFASGEGSWERLRPDLRAGLVRHALRWCEEFDDPEATSPSRDALGDLLVPVLLTSGQLSPPFLRRINEALSGRLRNVTLRVLPDVGHVPHVTRPFQYVGLVTDFLLERNVPPA